MSSENLQKWALIAEIVGGVAVVVSLFYVAYQVKENTSTMQAASAQEVSREFREMLSFDVLDNEISIRLANGEELSDAEKLTLGQRYTVMFRTYENIWYQATRGSMDPELYDGYKHHIRITLYSDAAQRVWSDMVSNGMLHPQFVQDTETFLADNPARRSTLLQVD